MEEIPIGEFRELGGLDTIEEGSSDDVFLTCVSYEDRTHTIIDSFSEEYEAEIGIIYINEELLSDDGYDSEKIQNNLEEAEEEMSLHCEDIRVIRGKQQDVKIQLNTLKENLANIGKSSQISVTLDITTFTRETLLIVLNILRSKDEEVNTRILYVSPEDYGEWLTRGHRKVRNIVGFAGTQEVHNPTLLVILFGFEVDRAINIIEEYEPSKLLLGVGDSPTAEEFLRRNLEEKKSMKLELNRQETDEFRFSANSISECEEALRNQLSNKLDKWDIILAPMSTKISTIGAYRFVQDHEDVQLAYCLPAEYNSEGYSEGAKKVHIDDLLL